MKSSDRGSDNNDDIEMSQFFGDSDDEENPRARKKKGANQQTPLDWFHDIMEDDFIVFEKLAKESKGGHDYNIILLDSLLYQYSPLVNIGMDLLNQNFSQCSDLLESLKCI